MRTGVILIGLLLAACGTPATPIGPSQGRAAASATTHRPLDSQCLDECLGDNAGKDFCEERCLY